MSIMVEAEGWTPERERRLLALWDSDWSAGQIAAELGGGLTRNAVIGKVHRLLEKQAKADALSAPAVAPPPAPAPKPPQPITEGYVRKGGQNPPPSATQVANRPPPPAPFRQASPPTPTPAAAIVANAPVPFLDRRLDQCALLVGPQSDLMCCGAPVFRRGASWCEPHHKKLNVHSPKGISRAAPQSKRSGFLLG